VVFDTSIDQLGFDPHSPWQGWPERASSLDCRQVESRIAPIPTWDEMVWSGIL